MDAPNLKQTIAARRASLGRRLAHACASAGPALASSKSTLKNAASRLDAWFLVAEADVAAPGSDSLPIELNFEYLRNVSKVDALLYAQGCAAKLHKSRLSWYGVFPFMGGFLVELHDGGSGKAFAPALVEAFGANAETAAQLPEGELPVFSAVLPTAGARSIMVELAATSVVTLVMPEHHEVPVSQLPRTATLTRLQSSAGLRALRVSMATTVFSLSLLGLILLLSPGAHRVALVDNNLTPDSPLPALNQPVPPDHKQVALTYKDGKWDVLLEAKPAETMPSLRNVADAKAKGKPVKQEAAQAAPPAQAAYPRAGKLAGAPDSVIGESHEAQ